jgi:four helix bundle protein
MHYEKLAVWRRSFRLSVTIYQRFTTHRDVGFKDQITRASLSVPSNIAEGYERITAKEQARFLAIAKGSVGELKTQIMIASAIGYLDSGVSDKLADECEQIGKILGRLIQTLKAKV